MALLAKEEDKEAIELYGGIGGAIGAPQLRLLRLLVCVEQSLGENGLFGGAMIWTFTKWGEARGGLFCEFTNCENASGH